MHSTRQRTNTSSVVRPECSAGRRLRRCYRQWRSVINTLIVVPGCLTRFVAFFISYKFTQSNRPSPHRTITANLQWEGKVREFAILLVQPSNTPQMQKSRPSLSNRVRPLQSISSYSQVSHNYPHRTEKGPRRTAPAKSQGSQRGKATQTFCMSAYRSGTCL